MRLGGQVEGHSEKTDKHFFPETDHFRIAEKGEMVEFQQANQCGATAQSVWHETDIGVGEQQPFAGRGFIGFLQSVWLAEPSLRQFLDVDYFQARVRGGEFVKDARGRVGGAIVDGDDFEIGIVEGDQRGEGGGKLFFFIDGRRRSAKCVDNRTSCAGSNDFNQGNCDGTVGGFESVA